MSLTKIAKRNLDAEADARTTALCRFAFLTPVLYAVIVVGGLVASATGAIVLSPLTAALPLGIAGFAVLRYRYWRGVDATAFAEAEVSEKIASIKRNALCVAALYGGYMVATLVFADAQVAPLIAIWASIVGAICAFCLNAFPALARSVLYVLLGPVALTLLFGGSGVERALGLTVFALMGLCHLLMTALGNLILDMRRQTETELKVTAATQRALDDFLSVSHDYNFETDATGAIVYASANFRRLTGVPTEQLIGRPLHELADETDLRTRENLSRYKSAFARNEAIRDLEVTSINADGRRLVTLTNAAPIIDDHRVFRGYRGWIVDVTAARNAEAELAENEARFRDFATLAADCLWETDAEGRYTFISDIVTEWTGVPVDQMIGSVRGEHYDDTSPPEFRAGWERHMQQLKRREPFKDYLIPTRYGKMLCTDGVPRFDKTGRFIGYRGYTRDITKEYEAKKAAEGARAALEETNRLLEERINERTASLRERTELLGEVLNTMSQGLVVVSDEGQVELLNDKAAGALPPGAWMVGTAFAETYASGLARADGGETFNLRAGDGAAGGDAFDAARIAQGEALLHYRRAADGQAFRETYTPRQAGGTVVTLSDITPDIRRQDELGRLKDEAEAASRAKSEFLANMSHEIRTPMNGVLGMAELLRATDLSAKQADMAEVILRSGDSLLTIINDILDFSKLEAGKMTVGEEPFDARAAIEDVASLVAPAAHKKSVELMVRIQPDLPLHLLGDAGRFRQVVTNLVGNAIKFTDHGHVLVDVSGRSEGGRTVLDVAVEDTGCGIPAEKLQSVFQKFEQVDGSASRRFEGTGLGLSISKKIAQIMGGDITVTSELGRGSVFTFSVALPETAPIGSTEEPPALEGLPVLIVDDNAVNRQILAEQLSAWGLSVTSVPSGAEGLAIARARAASSPFALVVLDHQMPVMDGAEFVRRLAADPVTAAMPRIMLTSADLPSDLLGLDGPGLSAYLVKPARANQLREAVIGALTDGSAALARAAASALRAPDASAASGAPIPAPKPGGAGAAADQEASGPLLLVAEDNQVNRMVVETMLSGTPYRVAFAENGEEAVARFEELSPDVMLMDVSMPVMDGMTATGEIRRRGERGACVPIIGVTAHALAEDKANCLAAGMSDYLSKPLSRTKLIEKLARWTGDQQAAPDAASA